jgi:hypothetical protein
MKRFTTGLLAAILMACTTPAYAGLSVENSSGKLLGFAAKMLCGAGLTCSITGAKVSITVSGGAGSFTTLTTSGVYTPSGGIALASTGGFSTFIPFPVTATTGVGTSTTPSATTVYLTSVYIDTNATLTGIAVNNAATCGTNSYIVALFNSAGTPLAHSLLTGTLCSGASAWQDIAFTATLPVVGPGQYFVGVFMNGTTDRFFTIPAAGEYVGLAGTNTGQTFGTVAAITPPTTFTAGAGVIVHTY